MFNSYQIRQNTTNPDQIIGISSHPNNHNYLLALEEFIAEIKQDKVLRLEERQLGFHWIHLATWYGDIDAFNLIQQARGKVLKLLPSELQVMWAPIHLAVSENGYTLLHCAAVNGRENMLDILLNLDIPIDAAPNDLLQTALHIAASNGHFEVAKKLAFHGASLDLVDKIGHSPAECAAANEHFDISNWLNEQEMLLAVQSNKLGKVKLLKEKDVSLAITDSNKLSLLLIATLANSEQVLKYLLSKKTLSTTECKLSDINGNTAIHLAAQLGYLNLLHILYPNLGINEKNINNNQTPLHVAILNRQLNFAETLIQMPETELEASASVTVNETFFTMTPLQIAAMMGQNEIIKLLFASKRVQATVHQEFGSLLHLAVHFNQEDTLHKLLTDYASYFPVTPNQNLVESKNQAGLTPLNLAAKLGYVSILEMLYQSHRAQLITKDNNGNTPAHWAVLHGHKNIILKLCDLAHSKEVINQTNNEFETPINLAFKHNKDKIKNLLASLLLNDGKAALNVNPKPWGYENLVFQGGGPKGIAYVGALAEYYNTFDIKTIRRVAGTSAGAIIAVFVALNVSPSGMKQVLSATDLTSFVDGKEFHSPKSVTGFFALVKNAYALSRDTGLSDGEVFRKWMEEQIKLHLGNDYQEHMTLGDLYNLIEKEKKPYKHLYIVGAHINDRSGTARMEVFSSENEAMHAYIISDLVRISMSIPCVFKPHYVYIRDEYKCRTRLAERLYVDGGIVNNFPIEIFDKPKYQPLLADPKQPQMFNRKTLGFSLCDPKKMDRFVTEYGASNQAVLKNSYELLGLVLGTIYDNELAHFNPANITRTIVIDNLNVATTDFSLSAEQKENLIISGRKAVQEFCAQHKELCRSNFKQELKIEVPELLEFLKLAHQDEAKARSLLSNSSLQQLLSPNMSSAESKTTLTSFYSSFRPQLAKKADVEQFLIPAPVTFLGNNNPILCLASLSAQQLAAGYADKSIRVWNLKNGSYKTLTGHTDKVRCLQALNETQLASGSFDSTIRIWDLVTGNCQFSLTGHSKAVRCLKFLGNDLLASGSFDTTIKIWNLNTRKCQSTLTGHSSGIFMPYAANVNCLELLSTNLLASGAKDCTIKIWDLTANTCKATLTGHKSAVLCLQLSPDNQLISSSQDRTIKIWNFEDGICQRTINTDHQESINYIQLLPNNHLATGSGDTTLKIWDLTSGTCQFTLTGHSNYVNGLQLLNNDKLASCSDDASIKIWDLSNLKLREQEELVAVDEAAKSCKIM